MKKVAVATLGALVFGLGIWSTTEPASALGGCGPNRHRSFHGYCVWGGQREDWCLRHRGHIAGFGLYGRRWCR